MYIVVISQILGKSCICNYSLNPQNNPKKELLLLYKLILHMSLLGQSNIKNLLGASLVVQW